MAAVVHDLSCAKGSYGLRAAFTIDGSCSEAVIDLAVSLLHSC